MAVMLSALRAGRALSPESSSGIHISWRLADSCHPDDGVPRIVHYIRATWCNIEIGGILRSLRRETLKSYITLNGWTV
jgi:hypothetical protein